MNSTKRILSLVLSINICISVFKFNINKVNATGEDLLSSVKTSIYYVSPNSTSEFWS